ncbi:MAG: tRNA pseudouridine(38-40) synthase TruA [Pseudomonadota bacterium]|uniref:tRNA pseudouridine synthase A n=1 Tax=Candidatus Desulfatibia profunda TaxID=2841695 RepID=A0A8J6NZS9_9BACT|nr:tRNA pseudouridine(38-40) synthase TruA [Candidatus Desulfatibia profunda]MBU0699030.1 tRNA pseudouridine(38-40) synthase TruA [Pseudomonadota bacterium]
MLKNFKLTIEYDGSAYHGWQRQATEPTIQAEIEKALMTMTCQNITLIGSGRTDAGVHAYGQTANFICDTNLTPEVFQRGLNSLLPPDIVITTCTAVPEAFNARHDAKSKTYHYRILNRHLPAAVGRQYAWHVPQALDPAAMRRAGHHIIGTHDFKAFEGAGSPRAHTTRRVIHADLVERDEGNLIFEIEGNGFLKFMVRNIVGTLVDVGLAKITSDDFKTILLSKDRKLAGVTAPAHGLVLTQVTY